MFQLLADTLVTAAVALLVAISFSLVYWVGRFFHFAEGSIIVVGAYLAYMLHSRLGCSIAFSTAVAATGCAALGAILEILVLRPLRNRGASSVTFLLASLGAYVILINLVTLIWGEQVRLFLSNQPSLAVDMLGARLSDVRLTILESAAVLGVAAWLVLTRTKPGRVFRALASSPDVAQICGIAEPPIQLVAIAVSSALAAYVGVLVAADGDLRPGMGLPLLLMGVTTAIVGEKGGVPGLVGGALMVSVSQTLGSWLLGMQWRDAATLTLLLIALLIKRSQEPSTSTSLPGRA